MMIGIGLQVVVCLAIAYLPQRGTYTAYWLNPIIALSSVMSPLPALEHLIVICLPFFVCDAMGGGAAIKNGGSTVIGSVLKLAQCALAVALLAACFDYNYVLLVPFLWALSLSRSGSSKQNQRKSSTNTSSSSESGQRGNSSTSLFRSRPYLALLAIILALLLAATFAYNGGDDGGVVSGNRWLTRHFRDTYSPSVGLHWYFEAQVFSSFRAYFVPLLSMQPSLVAVLLFPVYCTHHHQQWQDDSEGKDDKGLLGYHLMVVVVLLFKPAMSLTDVAFGGSLLVAYHRDTLSLMRRKAWVVTGLLVPTVLSPVLAHTWIQRGTGNANFLFFQCLVLWFFSALALVEIVRASALSGEEVEIKEEKKNL
jgi:hypothetical protein